MLTSKEATRASQTGLDLVAKQQHLMRSFDQDERMLVAFSIDAEAGTAWNPSKRPA